MMNMKVTGRAFVKNCKLNLNFMCTCRYLCLCIYMHWRIYLCIWYIYVIYILHEKVLNCTCQFFQIRGNYYIFVRAIKLSTKDCLYMYLTFSLLSFTLFTLPLLLRKTLLHHTLIMVTMVMRITKCI